MTRNRALRLADGHFMDPDFTSHELAADHVVVEVHERLTAPAPGLELHVSRDAATGVTIAWWEADDGTRVARARVGAG